MKQSAITLVFALLLMATSAMAATHVIPMDATSSKLELDAREGDALRFTVDVADLEAIDVDTPEGRFSRLILPGFHTSQVVGAPELPMMNRLMEIPYGADIEVEILSTRTREIDLAEFGIANRLMPAQPSCPKNVAREDWPFIYEPASYRAEPVAQELVQVVELGTLRSVRFGRLEVSPVAYYPSQNKVVVTESIEFRVNFPGVNSAAEARFKAATASPFFNHLYEGFAGTRTMHDDHPDHAGDIASLVIVTPPEFETQLADFIEWKTQRGLLVTLAVTGTPEVGSTKESIQSYLHGLYNNATPEAPAPTFVLFVGDVAQIPAWSESGYTTDRPYCAVDGDHIPDMYYGRFSATNPTMLQTMIDKTMLYEQFAMSDPSYLSEVVMTAGYDTGYGASHGNGQINYGTEHYFNADHDITSHTYLYPESGSSAAQIIQNVSDGVAFANYTAHGGVTYWVDPEFNQTDLNNLQNSEKYCLAIGNCCVTGSFGADECFGETWLRVADKGGIGYIGASMNTQWNEDYWWGVGFHPSSEITGPAIPYEDCGLGAYDGIFHDHGEAMTQWYITNDAIVFSGNLAVSESGSGSANNYWTTYNLQGDPSLSIWIGTPQINPVDHMETIFTTHTSLEITAAPNSYCGLTRDGVLLGAGTVPESGVLDMEFFTNLTPGPVHLVVMGQFMEPYITDINVIVPATITFDPETIDVNTPTVVTIGVFESDGVTPKPGIDVWAEGLNYSVPAVATGVDGYCQLTIDYSYGPNIDICGQDPADPWRLFTEQLGVNAEPLRFVVMGVETDIGLSNAFPLNLPGTLNVSAAFGNTLPPHDLFLYLNGTEVGSTTGDSYVYTATELGTVQGIFAADGYDLVTRDYDVIEAYGTLTGTILAAGSPAAGAVIKLYDDAMQLVGEATAGGTGAYDFGEEILVADYTATIDYFGYLPYEEDIFVNYGANVHDVDLIAAPAGVITGTVTEFDTGTPLEATIKVYRSDNMELMSEVMTDGVTGEYTTASLPYFDYVVNVRAWHHMPATITITVDEPSVVKNFILEETIGNLLVLDDESGKTEIAAKYDEKTGMLIAPGYTSDNGKAAADIVADLEYLGYAVELETLSASDPLTWLNYDLLILSTGDNDDAVTNPTDLINYVQAGGHILVEGGEVGYDHQTDAFAQTVLHITDWTGDLSGNVTVVDSEHNIVSVPNAIPATVTMAEPGFADHDALVVDSEAVMIANWSEDDNASIIAYDTNPAPDGGQIVFFAFNYSVMDVAVRPNLLQNAVIWLTTPEVGDCSVSGTVTLAGETDHSGVLVQAIPNGGQAFTAADGTYSLPGLYAGDYMIKASKEGWSVASVDVSLTSGENLTGVDMNLTEVFEDEFCSTNSVAITDNHTITDVIDVDMDSQITSIEVFLDITHTYIGDLDISLTSPAGTIVKLHDNSGSSADDIYGWYPDPLVPAESLDAFLGEEMQGDWTLTIADEANGDTGSLNGWCMNIGHGVLTAIGDNTPAVLSLGKNYPNPFNPTTTVVFALPAAGAVDLAIYDVTGRRVATLINGQVAAGNHEVVWQGTDDSGNKVASGLYFSRLLSDNKVLTRKMMLLK